MKIFSALIFSLAIFSVAQADFTSTSFELENPVTVIEGGQSSSSSFQYISSTGQLTSGQGTSSSFIQNVGFLYFPVEVSATPPVVPGGGGGSGVVVLLPGLDINCTIADFNCDTHVNLLDLSILIYYIGQTGPTIDLYDLNNDNRVGLVDISIMFYYWDDV